MIVCYGPPYHKGHDSTRQYELSQPPPALQWRATTGRLISSQAMSADTTIYIQSGPDTIAILSVVLAAGTTRLPGSSTVLTKTI